MTEVKRVTITLARPIGPNDPGAVEVACYTVVDNIVTLTTEDGSPIKQVAKTVRRMPSSTWSRKMRPDEIAHRVAQELLWAKYRASKSASNFNRPIRYPPLSIA